jgi:hypothetical protein
MKIPLPLQPINSILLPILALFFLSSQANGYGREGNRIIGALADAHLTPPARKIVRSLLGEDKTLASVATWADKHTARHPYTGNWHRVLIPLKTAEYDSSIHGQKPDAVTALTNFIKVLRHASTSSQQKAKALKWIINLIGDIHQLLNVIAGNEYDATSIQVIYSGKTSTLYELWEGELIKAHYKKPRKLSHEIMGLMDPGPDSNLFMGWSLVDWVNETHQLAETCFAVGEKSLISKDTLIIPDSYGRKSLDLLKHQLKKAGLRLAYLLNWALVSETPNDPFRYAWSKNSKVYHFTSCSSVKRIKSENVILSDLQPGNKTLHQKCPRLPAGK